MTGAAGETPGFYQAQTRARRIILLIKMNERARICALLLLEFASRSAWDDAGLLVAWPAVGRLAAMLGWNERMVQRARETLAKVGAFAVLRPGGRGRRSTAQWAAVPAWLAQQETVLLAQGRLDGFGGGALFGDGRLFKDKDDEMAVALSGGAIQGDGLAVAPAVPALQGDNTAVILSGGSSQGDEMGVILTAAATKGDTVGQTVGQSDSIAAVIPIFVDKPVGAPVDKTNPVAPRTTGAAGKGDKRDGFRATSPMSPEGIDLNNKNITAPARERSGKGDRKAAADARQRELRVFGEIPGGIPGGVTGKTDRADRVTSAAATPAGDLDAETLVRAVTEAALAAVAAALPGIVQAALAGAAPARQREAG